MRAENLIYFLCVVAVAAGGCASSPMRYTPEEIKDYSPETQESIIREEIVTGMTPHQVRYAWGGPKENKAVQSQDGKTSDDWIYSYLGGCRTKLSFSDGKLFGIALSDAGRAKSSDGSPSVRYTMEEIKDYPPEVQQNIVNGEVMSGMTPQQVRYAWGGPDSFIHAASKSGSGPVREEWVYSSGVLCRVNIIFSDGKMFGVARAAGPLAK
ncbi:MAG: hypothetical protein HQL09_07575 [Nitrospirae bacterium]|nr:hypothetical protein [Nitrospirota bacterium]